MRDCAVVGIDIILLCHVWISIRHGVEGLEMLRTFSDYWLALSNDTHLFGKTGLVSRSAASLQDLSGVLDTLQARRKHYARNVLIEVAEVDGGCIATVPKG